MTSRTDLMQAIQLANETLDDVRKRLEICDFDEWKFDAKNFLLLPESKLLENGAMIESDLSKVIDVLIKDDELISGWKSIKNSSVDFPASIATIYPDLNDSRFQIWAQLYEYEGVGKLFARLV